MSITRPIGFKAAAATAGIKPSGKPDLALIVREVAADPHTSRAGCAAVFTRSQIVGAPVIIGRRLRQWALQGEHTLRAFLINAGNSNAATGERGIADAQSCMKAVADAIGCHADAVLPSSTGVIGRLLPADKIVKAIPAMVASLARGVHADDAAAGAIMTTDLVPKRAYKEFDVGGYMVRIGAIAKGSGMIAPRLDSAFSPPTPSATMLAFLTTDASIDTPALQASLEGVARGSFERISVDNHPSCSDTVAMMASGLAEPFIGRSKSPMPEIIPGSDEHARFTDILGEVCTSLAEQIVTDGEGAKRTFKVTVRGVGCEREAERIAREIVNSPLVKCAIHGQDPNWGRIVTAAGNAGVVFDPSCATLRIGPVEVFRQDMPIPEALSDPRLAAAMAAKRVEIDLSLGSGPGAAWMIGCDLSAQYVSINADYTT